jgi:hypothetical protein
MAMIERTTRIAPEIIGADTGSPSTVMPRATATIGLMKV